MSNNNNSALRAGFEATPGDMRSAPLDLAPNHFAQSTPAQKPPSYPFPYASLVRHIKSDGMYVIVLEPDLLKLESSVEPAYGYRSVGPDGSLIGPLWALSQVEMEDGRFELVIDSAEEEQFLDAESMLALGVRTPDFVSMLRLSQSCYEATYTSADGKRSESWDCTGFLCANYKLAEFWEIVEEKNGSFLSDSLREDGNAPKWVQDSDGDLGVVTVRSVS